MEDKRMEHQEDDGRTIADMSDLHQAPSMGGQPRGPKQFETPTSRRPEEELTVRERLSMIWMALRAALLIGLVFLAGFGLIIWLMLFFWA